MPETLQLTLCVQVDPLVAAIDALKALNRLQPQTVETFLRAFPIEQLFDVDTKSTASCIVLRPSYILMNFLGSFKLGATA